MINDPEDGSSPDIADRVDDALRALWKGGSGAFDELLDDQGGSGPGVAQLLGDVAAPNFSVAATIEPDACIAGYKIVRELGRGGMGVVYEAQQQNPRRPVALKVIRDSRALDSYHIKLFEREVLTLARLKHPNIAAIYEAGTTESGQRFYAMELIRGSMFTAYVDGNAADTLRTPLELPDRLRLFGRVCDAINYAHQRGVIHRDLKPSNILVTDEPDSHASGRTSGPWAEVKILDFGLARVTGGEKDFTTISGDAAGIKGTLAYMSPEQAREEPDAVDVRSDVYSLGVILYEIIAAKLPYDTRHAPIHQAVHMICEQPPPKLKSKLGPVDADLETIVLKALEKAPADRYQSAAALAEDVDRYLNNQPILARPPSAAYQLRKLVARHKIPFTLGAAFVAVVMVFAVYTSTQATHLARERDKAVAAERLAETRLLDVQAARSESEQAGQKVAAINRFLNNMLASADPSQDGRDVKVVDVLDKAVAGIDETFLDKPEIESALRSTIGNTYRRLGMLDKARTELTKSLELLDRKLGRDHPDTLFVLHRVANVYQDLGDASRAERLLREAFEKRRRVLGDDDPNTLDSMNSLAQVLQERGRLDEAETLFRSALERRRRVLGQDHKDTLISMNDLAGVLMVQGKLAEAEPLCRQALELQRRLLGDDHVDTLVSINDLAAVLKRQGRLAEAMPLYRQSYEGLRRVLGEDHMDTLITLNNLAGALRQLGRSDEATPLAKQVVQIAERTLPANSWYTAMFKAGYASCLVNLRRYPEAEEQLEPAYETVRAELGDEHAYTIGIIKATIELYEKWQQPEKLATWRAKLASNADAEQ